ncbi:MAG: hypothetical protein NVS4B3_01530 [Gemmatimonadaceae bacterium]
MEHQRTKEVTTDLARSLTLTERGTLVAAGAALVVAVGTVCAFAVLGWPPPHIDTWAAIGVARTVASRPIAGFGAGTVPKLGQLFLVGPAALGGLAWAKVWIALIGIAAVGTLVGAHRFAMRSLRASGDEIAWTMLLLVLSPLLWRASVDGGSTGWSWAAIITAVALRGSRRDHRALTLLAAAAVLRPEAVGAAAGVAVVEGWALLRQGGMRGMRAPWREVLFVVLVPVIAGVGAVLVVDLWWTGHAGAAAASHAAFIREYARLEPPLRTQMLQHLGTILFGLGPLAIALALLGAPRQAPVQSADSGASPGPGRNRPSIVLAAAGIGWIAAVAGNSIAGGPLFDRFLIPLSTAVAVPGGIYAARRWGHGTSVGKAILLLALLFSASLSWGIYFPRFAGRGAAAAELLVERGARIVAGFSAEEIVGADQLVRAVAVGGGLHPWRTTFALSDPVFDPCTASALVLRQFGPALPGSARIARCRGGWLLAGQMPEGITVLLRGAR